MKFKLFFIILCISSMTLFAVHNPPASAANKTSRVLILPFSIQSDSDLGFLQKGISSMLYSRLSLSGKTTLIRGEEVETALQGTPRPIDASTALALGKQFTADYVLMGNLTVFGESVSTDSVLLDVGKQAPALKFSQSGQNRGDTINHINLFANQINAKLFGYRPLSPRTARSAGGTTGRGYASNPYAAESNVQIWKSRKFKTEIIGLAVGDVDADGNNETVFVSNDTIFIYRFQENAFRKISEIPGKPSERIIRVDIADINKNGKTELFITNVNERNNRNLLKSYVLEWDETYFKEIAGNQKWFFGISNVSEHGKVLMGQKIGLPPKLLQGTIFALKSENGDYTANLPQELPKGLRIGSFAQGDITNDGMQRIVAFDENERIMLLNADGKEEWISSDRYGGNANYLEYPAELRDKDKRDLTDHFYLPQRIHVADMDRDGKNEVLVVSNHEVAERLFQRLRLFDSGYIECLYWNTLGLQRKWRTLKISGYISDYQIADLNNDGRDEVVFSVVAHNRRNLLAAKKSYIATYEQINP